MRLRRVCQGGPAGLRIEVPVHESSEDGRGSCGALLAEGAQVDGAVTEDGAEEGGTDQG